MVPMHMDPRRTLTIALPLVLLSLVTAHLPAQLPTATLELTVRSSETAEPLAGAQVAVEGLGFLGVTDQQGYLRIQGLPEGARALEVRYLGYEPLDETVSFAAGRIARIIVELQIRPISLATVQVRARTTRLDQTGFHDRQRLGHGSFFTRDQIASINPRVMSDVLRRVSGIQLIPHALGSTGMPIIRVRNSGCPVNYFVDGVPMAPGYNVDFLHPGVVEGMEVYKGGSTVPVAFNRGDLACGLIVIWTRQSR
jgi:hypothetical protein